MFAEVDAGCAVYTNLTDPWRNILSTFETDHYDDALTTGWYRMIQNGLNAKMPTFCPASTMCGTNSPMWYSGNETSTIS